MAKNARIAIIGAGLGGIPAAAMLRARGQNVTIYEQAPAFARLGAGINLGPNIMKIMREIGIEDHLRRTGIEPNSWANREWNTGRMQFEFMMKGELGRDYGAPYMLIHRRRLSRHPGASRPAGNRPVRQAPDRHRRKGIGRRIVFR